MGYIVLYCNRFITLFTQIIRNRHKKANIFRLTVQYLEKYSSPSYITTAFTLASGHPGLEIKILYCCTLYGTVQQSPQKHSHLERVHARDSVRQTYELTYVTGHASASLKVRSLKVRV